MNAPVGRRSAATAVITAAIAHWMTYVFRATVTTYKRCYLTSSDGQVSGCVFRWGVPNSLERDLPGLWPKSSGWSVRF